MIIYWFRYWESCFTFITQLLAYKLQCKCVNIANNQIWCRLSEQNQSDKTGEYISVSKVITEILFINHIMDFLQVKLGLLTIVNCYNVGAIFLGYKAKSSPRIKHIGVRYHFIREHIEDLIVKILFVRSYK